jgi:outer membrane protein insertion porin family
MRHGVIFSLGSVALAFEIAAQAAVDVARPEERQRAQRAVVKEQEKRAKSTSIIEFRGQQAFKEKDLRVALKEEITTIQDFGLSPARADDLAFFLEVFYRKHGYAKVDVHYTIESTNRLRLDIAEGPRFMLRNVIFDGNAREPTEKLFDYMVGPTRERYSRLEKRLPFVAADMEEGTGLVQRFYVADGFLDAVVDPPRYKFQEGSDQVDVIVPIHEGQQYFFGSISFSGPTIYGADELRSQIFDLLQRPYTDARLEDIPRRLEAYFKARGYYDVKVEANGAPEAAGSRVPVEIAIAPGPVYHFDGATVSGLQRLHPSFVTNRFTRLRGKTYSPDALDERFRTLMKTGLFNVLQIKPVPVDGHLLRLDISAEEAKSKEFGFWVGFDTYEGALAGVQVGDRDLFGTGRAGSATIEVSQRSYRGELLYEDPFFLDTDFVFKARAYALTFNFDGYTKFELGGRLELSRKITKYDEAALILAVRHVKITDSEIGPEFLVGPTTNYLVNTIGVTNTLDLRESPYVNPRGFLVKNTLDVAPSALGSDIEFIRGTMGVGYYLPFGPKPLTPGVVEDQPTGTPLQRWFRQSSIAFGARVGIIHSLTESGSDEATAIPIDERFFNGGATTVRSFGERELGPHDNHGHPVGGEFFTVFNVEYTFPIFGELQGAIFADAGNLLPTSEDIGLNDMRYAIGAGLRYKLPVGPIRLDYGVNPDPRPDEDFGAFHFSFGFAF